MKFLIGIDGSEHSFAAVALAGQFISPERDRVALYHGCTPINVGKQVDATLRHRACQAVADVVLDEAKTRLPAGMGAAIETIVDNESAASGLVEAAKRSGADVIVVGARGLGRLGGLLLGTVSGAVVRAAQLPVLVVRQRAAASQPLKVLLAYDSIHGQQHADFLRKLTWPSGATGLVAAVIEPLLPSHLPEWIRQRARDADTEAMSQVWVDEHQQERTAKEAELAAYQAQLPAPWASRSPVVLEGNPAEQLIELVDREQPSLIVVGKAMKNLFDRFFLGSVSEKVLARAECSVLVIPARGT